MPDYEVLTAGGGIAGVAAAVASSRTGARTILVERYGFLGGMATAGLVNPFMTHRTSDGQPLIAGFFAELCERLDSNGGLKGNTFDSETMKFVLQEMALDAGVELMLHSQVTGAIMDGAEIRGISLQIKDGIKKIRAGRVIDATGDGDVAALAGAAFEKGDPEQGRPQAMTLMLDIGGVDLEKALAYVKNNPDQMRFPKLSPDTNISAMAEGVISVSGYYDFVSQARANGDFPLPGDLVFYISRPRRGEVVMNTTHVGNVDGTSSEDLTRAEVEGRRQAVALSKFLREYIPGFQNSYLSRTATQIGIRETRRITGEYVFSAQDVAEAAKFPDVVARLAYPVDVHSPRGSGYTRAEEKAPPVSPPPGDWYEIPYRCLLPVGVENLLIAGRCVSSTHEGHGAIRIIPCCAAMGQAAGAAAALSLQNGTAPRSLDFSLLRKTLTRQGALV
jgi:hypothetical protein